MDNRIRELEESLAATLGFLPEIDIATSIVVAVVVIVGLVILARRPDVTLKTRKSRESRQRRKAMQSSPSSTTSGGTGFSIRWGRLAIFGVGAIALLVAVICVLAGLFGAGTWITAGISVLVTAASYGALRGLAIMDSQKRAREREKLSRAEGLEATIAHYTTETSQQQAYVNTNDEVFDVADEQPAEQLAEPVETPVVEQPVAPASAPVPARKPVPRPMYLDTPEVEREAPEPLETPEEPTPSRQVQLSEGVSSQYQDKIQQKANTRLDLDKVLNRRRAI
ncbi:MAG: hypothetical protein ACTH1B_10325 [Yaniella sp.]|uniref:hypothetical protein n=1 Tax=Yaniella sp. TaxID=2773929 RepID=UPI003F962FE5